MSIVINELSLKVGGSVIKNNDANGNSILRMSQDQAREIYADLGRFFNAQDNGEPNKTSAPVATTIPVTVPAGETA